LTKCVPGGTVRPLLSDCPTSDCECVYMQWFATELNGKTLHDIKTVRNLHIIKTHRRRPLKTGYAVSPALPPLPSLQPLTSPCPFPSLIPIPLASHGQGVWECLSSRSRSGRNPAALMTFGAFWAEKVLHEIIIIK